MPDPGDVHQLGLPVTSGADAGGEGAGSRAGAGGSTHSSHPSHHESDSEGVVSDVVLAGHKDVVGSMLPSVFSASYGWAK